MQNRAFRFEIKSVNEQGVFTGMASVFVKSEHEADQIAQFRRVLAECAKSF